jgi:hypothetical protein
VGGTLRLGPGLGQEYVPRGRRTSFVINSSSFRGRTKITVTHRQPDQRTSH